MDVREIIDAKIQRMALMIEANTQKIVRKELKKLKKEIVKEMLKK